MKSKVYATIDTVERDAVDVDIRNLLLCEIGTITTALKQSKSINRAVEIRKYTPDEAEIIADQLIARAAAVYHSRHYAKPLDIVKEVVNQYAGIPERYDDIDEVNGLTLDTLADVDSDEEELNPITAQTELAEFYGFDDNAVHFEEDDTDPFAY